MHWNFQKCLVSLLHKAGVAERRSWKVVSQEVWPRSSSNLRIHSPPAPTQKLISFILRQNLKCWRWERGLVVRKWNETGREVRAQWRKRKEERPPWMRRRRRPECCLHAGVASCLWGKNSHLRATHCRAPKRAKQAQVSDWKRVGSLSSCLARFRNFFEKGSMLSRNSTTVSLMFNQWGTNWNSQDELQVSMVVWQRCDIDTSPKSHILLMGFPSCSILAKCVSFF
jgi:hypothetical protein